MKVCLEVKDRREAEAVRRAWERADVRAFVLIVGTLDPLSPRAQARVLGYVADKLDEEAAQ